MTTRHVVLLRGINVGASNRIAMAPLRQMLESLGYTNVRTLLQSGNAVVTAPAAAPGRVAAEVEAAIRDTFGMTIQVVVRNRQQLAKVIAQDPFGEVATNPSWYFVGFCEPALPATALSALDPVEFEPERFAVRGGTLYLWYPNGSQNSPLEKALAKLRLDVVLTMRNWRTVAELLELADG